MKRLLVLVVTVVVVACALCPALAAPVLLEFKFTKGQVDKFNVTANISMSFPGMIGSPFGSGMNLRMTDFIQQRVLAVYADGSAKLRVFMAAPKITGISLPKSAQKDTSGHTFVAVMSKHGKVLSVEGMDSMLQGTPASGMDFGQLENCYLPTDPVDVGATWSNVVPVPMAGGQMIIKSKLTSAGDAESPAQIEQTYSGHVSLTQLMKTFGSAMAGKINTADLSGLDGGMEMSGAGHVTFSPSIGKLINATSDTTMAMTINMPAEAVRKGAPPTLNMNFTGTMTLTRIQ